MKAGGQRTKGHNGERDVVKIFKKIGIDLSRNLIQTREGGSDLITDGTPLEKYSIEVKRTSRWTPGKRIEWINQTVREAEKIKKIPVLIWRLDQGPWIVEWYDGYAFVLDYLDRWKDQFEKASKCI